MLKKGLFISVILALTSSVALANGGSFVPPPEHIGAAYIGLAISGDAVKYDAITSASFLNNLFPAVSEPVPTASAINFDWGSKGIDGEIFAGYGMTFRDHYTLGAEIFGSLASDNAKFNLNFFEITHAVTPPTAAGVSTAGTSFPFTTPVSLKLKHTVGIAILPGIKISPSTTFYGRMGLVDTRFQLNDPSGVLTLSNGFSGIPPILVGSVFPLDFSTNKYGIQLGLGFSTLVHHNIGIRGEFDWSKYNSIDKSEFFDTGFNNPVFVFPPDVVTSNGLQKFQPELKQVKVGVFYNFA